MNTLSTTSTIYYTCSSRTIETVLVSNAVTAKPFYVYNYEGYSFRVFETKKEVSNYFNLNVEAKFHFDREDEMDDYLMSVKF
mgnify:CR=1 FL=1